MAIKSIATAGAHAAVAGSDKIPADKAGVDGTHTPDALKAWAQGIAGTINSGATTDLATVDSLRIVVANSVTITSFGTGVNQLKLLQFSGAPLITYNATSLKTPNAKNIQIAAGDTMIVGSDASGNWTVWSYVPAKHGSIQIFTASGTANKPGWATSANIFVMTAGAGGGSGRRGAAGAIRCGGGGGSSGAIATATLPASIIADTETVTVGTGGPGGAAQTVNDTNGNAGTNGGSSSFGTLVVSAASAAGSGGTNATGTGGTAGSGTFNGATGAAASTTGLLGATGSSAGQVGGGGGSGGGLTTANVESAGGLGGTAARAHGDTSTGTVGPAGSSTPGGNGTPVPTNLPMGGGGGSGGGSSNTTAAGAGGNGGLYGGAGAGGGASLNGFNSGKGGDGADGIVIVIWN